MENLITAQDITDYAPDLDLSSFTGPTISGMITRASNYVINYCNVDGFLQQAVTNEREKVRINPEGDLIMSFHRRPVAQGSVTAVRLKTINSSISLSMTDASGNDVYYIPTGGTYMVYPSNFLLSLGYGLLSVRYSNARYELDYTGGYNPIPDAIKEATTLVFRQYALRRINPLGASEFRQGNFMISNRGVTKPPLLSEAQNILDEGGYIRQVIF